MDIQTSATEVRFVEETTSIVAVLARQNRKTLPGVLNFMKST